MNKYGRIYLTWNIALFVAIGCKITITPGINQTSKAEPGIKQISDAELGIDQTVKAKPGTVLWEFETGDKVYSSPAIGTDGTVYIGSEDKKVYALKTNSKGPAKSPWPMRGQNAQHVGRVIK